MATSNTTIGDRRSRTGTKKKPAVAAEVAGTGRVSRKLLVAKLGEDCVRLLELLWHWRDALTGVTSATTESLHKELREVPKAPQSIGCSRPAWLPTPKVRGRNVGLSERSIERYYVQLRALGLVEQPSLDEQGTRRSSDGALAHVGAGGLGFQTKNGATVFMRRVFGAPALIPGGDLRVPDRVVAALEALPAFRSGQGKGGGGQIENIRNVEAGKRSGLTKQRRTARIRKDKGDALASKKRPARPDLLAEGSRPFGGGVAEKAPDLLAGRSVLSPLPLDPLAYQDLRSGGAASPTPRVSDSFLVGDDQEQAATTPTPKASAAEGATSSARPSLGDGTGRGVTDSVLQMFHRRLPAPGSCVGFATTPAPPTLPDDATDDEVIAILVGTYRQVIEAELGVLAHLDARRLGPDERRRLLHCGRVLRGLDSMCPDAPAADKAIAPASWVLWRVREWIGEQGSTRAKLSFVFGSARDAEGAGKLRKQYEESSYRTQLGGNVRRGPKTQALMDSWGQLHARLNRLTTGELEAAIATRWPDGYLAAVADARRETQLLAEELRATAARWEWVWGGKSAPRKATASISDDAVEQFDARWASTVAREEQVAQDRLDRADRLRPKKETA